MAIDVRFSVYLMFGSVLLSGCLRQQAAPVEASVVTELGKGPDTKPPSVEVAEIGPVDGTSSWESSRRLKAGALFRSEAEKELMKGKSYTELRGQLIQAGWFPLRDPKCWETFDSEAAACNHFPEIQHCTPQGRCLVKFAEGGSGTQVSIEAQGHSLWWSKPSKREAARVKTWSFLRTFDPWTKEQRAACPSKDFGPFLKEFASKPLVKRAFTAPLVKVMELGSDDDVGYPDSDEGYRARAVYVAAVNYDGFNIAYEKDGFHFVNYKGETDPTPLRMNITSMNDQNRTLRYQYGASEGNSYRFEFEEGCWFLTEEPEPPSP